MNWDERNKIAGQTFGEALAINQSVDHLNVSVRPATFRLGRRLTVAEMDAEAISVEVKASVIVRLKHPDDVELARRIANAFARVLREEGIDP